MFAYCNNNPAIFKDEAGTYFRKAIAIKHVNDSGDDVWYRPIDTSRPSEFAKEMDLLFHDFIEMKSIPNFIDVYERVMQYEPIQNFNAIDQISSGWELMKKGFAAFMLPFPTWVDEAIGYIQIEWGLGEIAQGVVELVD